MPRLYILAGCNGAGKTTASYTFLPEILDCNEFVNSDEFAKSLSPFDPSTASISASRLLLRRIEYLLEHGEDFSIETTLATRSLVSVITEAQSLNYTVTMLYLWVQSPEMANQRVRNRVEEGGHNIAEHVLRRRYLTGLRYLFEIYLPICDRWMIADNSGQNFELIAEGDRKHSIVRDEEKYQRIRELVEGTDDEE